MEYAFLSGTGIQVSRLALGTAVLGVAPAAGESTGFIHRAIDLGINFIDTANTYGNQARFDRPGVPAAAERASAEELVGRAIADRRDRVILATKVSESVGDGPNDGGAHGGGGGLSRVHINRMIERSLRRLHTDHIDLYYAHHPDPATDIADVLSTFNILIDQGKICHYGLSTYQAWQFTEAVLTADKLGLRRPVCHQFQYSLAQRGPESDVIPAALRYQTSTTAFSPLGGGLFAGDGPLRRYSGSARWGGPGFTAAERALGERVRKLARVWEVEPFALALAWLKSRPAVAAAIVGPESVTELEGLVAASELTLSREQLEELNTAAAI
jgi:aryl-alcohol dehydrogenase-like predicted oxidoreductase